MAAARAVRLWDQALRQKIYLGDEALVERMQPMVEPQRAAARAIAKELALPRQSSDRAGGNGEKQDPSL